MKKTGIVLAIALMAGVSAVRAADYNWTTGTGNWTDAWDGGGYPSNSVDRAFVLGGTQNLTPTSNPGTDLTAIEVKASAAGTTLNINQYIRTANNFVMSWNNTGTATVNHSANEFRSNGDVWLGGSGTGSANIYNLTSTGILKSPGAVMVARGGIATMNIAGGTLDSWGGNTTLGENAGSVGTVNLSDGLLKQSGGAVYVGNNGSGTVNQTGGKLWLNGANMVVANTTTGSGAYTISGGEIDVTIGRWVLVRDGGIFSVDGSGATSIEMSRLEIADGGTVQINLDAGGSTLVKSSRTDVGQGLTFSGILELDTIAGFAGSVGDSYDLFWAQTGNLETNSMTFANLSTSTDFALSIVSKDGGDMLQATVIPEPSTLALMGLIGAVLVAVRRSF